MTSYEKYWKSDEFDYFKCKGKVYQNSKGNFLVTGRVHTNKHNAIVEYIAASPADHRSSYAGSGLPFPNAEMAYENTPNRGAVKTTNGYFEIRISYPNAFYVEQGTKLLRPHLLIKTCEKDNEEITVVPLGENIPDRTLTTSPGNFIRSIK